MFPDFKELLSALNAHQVKYLVVGGYAVSFHSQPRHTRDLDILIKPDAENARAAYAALAQFGAPLQGLSAQDLVEPGSFFRMGVPPVMIDILPRISGVDFDEAWQRRVTVAIDDALSAPFISREDLLAAKIAAGRPQDLADVAALGAAAQSRGANELHGAATAVLDPLEAQKQRAREEWLKLRQQQLQGSDADPEETRARAREDWLKLREQQGARPASTDRSRDEGLDRDSPQNDVTKDRGPGVDDTDS